jgi:hypothetical protein
MAQQAKQSGHQLSVGELKAKLQELFGATFSAAS